MAQLGSLQDNDKQSFVLDANSDVARRVVVTSGPGAPANSKELRQATATTSNVPSSATNVTLLAANSNRLSASFYNDSTKDLYLKHGATASTSSFTVLMPARSFYELPFPCYTGIIDGLWATANGNCRVTEGVA